MQTSEGPSGAVPEFQVGALLVDETGPDPSRPARPATPRACAPEGEDVTRSALEAGIFILPCRAIESFNGWPRNGGGGVLATGGTVRSRPRSRMPWPQQGDHKVKFGTKRIAGALLVLGAALAVAAGPVLAARGTFIANTTPVPHAASGSGLNVTGTATLTLQSKKLTAHITASGLSPLLPHLMHIHGVIGAQNDCPDITADESGDGFIDTPEGQPAYGPIIVTFSTTGDTSAAAGLNLETAVVADENGHIDYTRTFTIPKAVAQDISNLHVVIHGADLDNSGEYDGDESALGMDIPLEAELPVSCGTIN